MKRWTLHCLLVVGIGSLFTVNAQSRDFRVNVGGGMMELLHAGVQITGNHWGAGAYAGMLPVQEEGRRAVSFGVDGVYLFHDGTPAGRSHPWFIRSGILFLQDDTRTVKDRYVFATLRLGKQWTLADHLVVSVDAGALVKLRRSRQVSGTVDEITPGFNIGLPVFPAGRVVVGYEF